MALGPSEKPTAVGGLCSLWSCCGASMGLVAEPALLHHAQRKGCPKAAGPLRNLSTMSKSSADLEDWMGSDFKVDMALMSKGANS